MKLTYHPIKFLYTSTHMKRIPRKDDDYDMAAFWHPIYYDKVKTAALAALADDPTVLPGFLTEFQTMERERIAFITENYDAICKCWYEAQIWRQPKEIEEHFSFACVERAELLKDLNAWIEQKILGVERTNQQERQRERIRRAVEAAQREVRVRALWLLRQEPMFTLKGKMIITVAMLDPAIANRYDVLVRTQMGAKRRKLQLGGFLGDVMQWWDARRRSEWTVIDDMLEAQSMVENEESLTAEGAKAMSDKFEVDDLAVEYYLALPRGELPDPTNEIEFRKMEVKELLLSWWPEHDEQVVKWFV